MQIDTWSVSNDSHDAAALAQFASVFTVSNGYLALQGSVAEQREGPGPVTLINGLYDELGMFSTIPASGRERPWLDAAHFDNAGRSPAVANLPTPLHLRVFVDGRELTLERTTVESFQQSLSLRNGVYRYEVALRDAAGRVTHVRMTRFASLMHAHRAFMRYEVIPENHKAAVRVISGVSGAVDSNTTRERQFEIRALDVDDDGRCTLQARTPARGIHVTVTVAHRLVNGAATTGHSTLIEHDTAAAVFEPPPGAPLSIERAIVLACSNDAVHGVTIGAADELKAAAAQGFDDALAQSARAWTVLWERSDVEIDGDAVAQRDLRFCLHHLLAAAPRFSDRLSVPVKLLSGEYYQGNTFYDTDLYILPFLTFTQPHLARPCVHFRWHGLKHGRATAKRSGYAGAKLAWQAGPEGEECLGDWYWFTRTNIHVNADACFAMMQYVRASGDESYLHEHGVDLLVESARFYCSRAVADDDGALHLHDVSGPDEGHCHSTDNFYTNVLAAWTLRAAARVLDGMQARDRASHDAAIERLAIQTHESQRWSAAADRLALRFDENTKVYEQYEGFYKLAPPPADLLANRSAWFEPIYSWKVLNQPDVLMAMVLLPRDFPVDVQCANYDYYYDRSMNFSSMSFVINAMMAAAMGDLDEAHRQFRISAGMDLDESLSGRRDTFAGLHGTAMGGAWMAAVFGFGGVHLDDDGLHITPRLPRPWMALRFQLALRGARLGVEITPTEVRLRVVGDRSFDVPVDVYGDEVALLGGKASVAYARPRGRGER